MNTGLCFHSFALLALFSLLCRISAAPASSCRCEDGIDNVLTVGSTGSENLPAILKKTTLLVYDEKMRPSCYDGRANVVMPGYFVAKSGELHIKRDLNVVDDGTVLMSINIDGNDICRNGGSDKFYMPDWICQFDATTLIPKELLSVLQTKGVHTLDELRRKIKFNTTMPLPPSPSVLGISLIDLFKGTYKVGATLVSQKEKIIEVSFPPDGSDFQLGMYDEDD